MSTNLVSVDTGMACDSIRAVTIAAQALFKLISDIRKEKAT